MLSVLESCSEKPHNGGRQARRLETDFLAGPGLLTPPGGATMVRAFVKPGVVRAVSFPEEPGRNPQKMGECSYP